MRSNSIKSTVGSPLPFPLSLESSIPPPRGDTVRRIISTVITSISGGSSPKSSLSIGHQTEVDATKEAVMKLKNSETSGKSSRSNSLTKDDDDSVFSGLNFSQSEEHDISEDFASLAVIPKRRRNSFIFVEYSASKDEAQKDNQGFLTVAHSASSISNEDEYPLSHLSLSACAEKLPPLLLRRSRDSSSFCSSVSSAVYTPVSLVGSGPSSRKASRPGSATPSLSPLKRTPSPTKRSGCYSPLVPLNLTPSNGSIASRTGSGTGPGKRHSSPSLVYEPFANLVRGDSKTEFLGYQHPCRSASPLRRLPGVLDDLLQSSGYTSTSTSEREKERSGGGRERGGGGSDRGREGGGGGGGGISILTSAAGMSGRSRRSSLEPLYESTLSTEVSPAIDYNRLDQKKKLKKRRSISTETQ